VRPLNLSLFSNRHVIKTIGCKPQTFKISYYSKVSLFFNHQSSILPREIHDSEERSGFNWGTNQQSRGWCSAHLILIHNSSFDTDSQALTPILRPCGIAGGLAETWIMEEAKRARKAETPKQPSRHLRSSAPYFYPDHKNSQTTKNQELTTGATRLYERPVDP